MLAHRLQHSPGNADVSAEGRESVILLAFAINPRPLRIRTRRHVIPPHDVSCHQDIQFGSRLKARDLRFLPAAGFPVWGSQPIVRKIHEGALIMWFMEAGCYDLRVEPWRDGYTSRSGPPLGTQQ